MNQQCECENDGWSEGNHDPECPNHLPPQILDSPERIWLCYGDISGEIGNFNHKDCEEVAWCEDKIDVSDIEYVRADTLPANWREDSSLETWFPIIAEELARLKAKNAALKSWQESTAIYLADADRALAVLFTMLTKIGLKEGAMVADETRANVRAAMKEVAHSKSIAQPLPGEPT